ncbi:MAG TPA: hypothetical protein DCW60_03890 [Sutterella sp.]|nr:hypothetical protein [Sutterella sp.]
MFLSYQRFILAKGPKASLKSQVNPELASVSQNLHNILTFFGAKFVSIFLAFVPRRYLKKALKGFGCEFI